MLSSGVKFILALIMDTQSSRDTGHELLRQLHKLHGDTESYDLAEEASRVVRDGPDFSKLELFGFDKEKLDRLTKEVRAVATVAISETATIYHLLEAQGLVDRNIKLLIKNGVHPLDAIAGAYTSAFQDAAKLWYNGDNSFSEHTASIKSFLDSHVSFVSIMGAGIGDGNAEGMLTRGSNVGTSITLGAIESIVDCWQNQFEEPIKPTVLENHLEAKYSYPLLRVWKWMVSGKKLDQFEKKIVFEPGTEENPYHFPKFNSSKFHLFKLKNDTDIWTPVPKQEVVDFVKSLDQAEPVVKKRGKCPADSSYDLHDVLQTHTMKTVNALVVGKDKPELKLKGHMSVLMELIDSMHKWAIEYWVPHYEKEYESLKS